MAEGSVRRKRRQIQRKPRNWCILCIATIGQTCSTTCDCICGCCRKRSQWREALTELRKFMKDTGIDEEMKEGFNMRLMLNLNILVRVQKVIFDKDRRLDTAILAPKKPTIPTFEDAERFMRFATAAYGRHMLESAAVQESNVRELVAAETKSKIALHTRIPLEDLTVLDVEYGGSMECLRHLVAVDRENKTVVLAIRGTFSMSELVIDVKGQAEPFCGGQAHSGMLEMAESLWEKARPKVREVLFTLPPDYEVVITGHSLGAGVACLLTIKLHHDGVVGDRKLRCFAFAPPPCFFPLSAAEEAISCITAYVHHRDCVPFLSVDSFRRLCAVLGAIDAAARKMSWFSTRQLTWCFSKPNEELVRAVQEARSQELREVEGAPKLLIPASAVVWMREYTWNEFNYVACDPALLSELGIFVHPNMITDHMPPLYETAVRSIE